jgi:hypothetical protein
MIFLTKPENTCKGGEKSLSLQYNKQVVNIKNIIMKPIIRLGRLRLFKTNNWKDGKREKEFKLEIFSIEVNTFFKYVCLIILNFEFEIDW